MNRLSPWAFDDLARGRESAVDVELARFEYDRRESLNGVDARARSLVGVIVPHTDVDVCEPACSPPPETARRPAISGVRHFCPCRRGFGAAACPSTPEIGRCPASFAKRRSSRAHRRDLPPRGVHRDQSGGGREECRRLPQKVGARTMDRGAQGGDQLTRLSVREVSEHMGLASPLQTRAAYLSAIGRKRFAARFV